MAHVFKFIGLGENFGASISEQEIEDLVTLVFDGKDTYFTIDCRLNEPGVRGRCMKSPGGFEIYLSYGEITSSLLRGVRMGGNKIHNNLKSAIMSVITHEVQHANQFIRHTSPRHAIYQGEYYTRPCEVEARRVADEHFDMIVNMTEEEFVIPSRKTDVNRVDVEMQLTEIADIFSVNEIVFRADLIEELRVCGLYNSFNMKKLISLVENAGCAILIEDA